MGEPAPDPLIGTTIAHFVVEARLGAGGMGVVYRARDTTLKRAVALKVLPSRLAGDEERRASLLKEARAAATFNHANVAAVYEVGEHEGRAYIAMELVAGRSVRALLQERAPLPLDLALTVAKQVARALDRAHTAGLIHRDLKPDNVMVADDGTVKLLDFGLAKRTPAFVSGDDTVEPVSREGLAMGTPGYMAPEQSRGGPIDLRADLFAFGVMLYEMLTGARPFAGQTPVEVVIASVRDPAPALSTLRPDLPAEVGALVARLLEKDRAARPANAAAVLGVLDALQPSAPGATPSLARTATRITPVTGRRRWVWVGVVLLAAGAVVAARLFGDRRVAVTDFPAIATTPEAARHYAAGLQSLRDGSLERAVDSFAEAARADPGLAAAHLRLAVYGAGMNTAAKREHLAAAARARANLSPRDRALLELADVAASEGPLRTAKTAAAFRAVLDRFPRDPELRYAGLQAGFDKLATEGEALEHVRAALALDPQFGAMLAFEGRLQLRAGRDDAALAVAEECTRRVPRAVECMRLKARLNIARGQCAAAQADAVQLIAWDPRDRRGHEDLALVLAATAAPVESVRSAFDRWVATFAAGPDRAAAEQSAAVRLGLWTGDFAGAQRAAAQLEQLNVDSPVEEDHDVATEVLMEVAEESGDWREALKIGEAYNRRASGWQITSWSWIRIRSLYLARRAGTLSDAEFAAERGRALATEKDAEAHNAWLAWGNWVYLHASFAETPNDVQAALAAMPIMTLTEPNELELTALTFLVRAGKGKEALPRLKQVVGVCQVMPAMRDRHLIRTLRVVRARLALGQVLEETGDVAGACASYRWIVRLWKDSAARPVSRLRAEDRMKALACP